MRRLPAEPPTVAAFPPAAVVGGTLAIDAGAARVIAALRREGVPSLLLRGPALRSWLYEAQLRWYDDVDLLVPPAAGKAARRVLAELGFVERFAAFDPLEYEGHSWEWWGGDPRVLVDLHRTLPGVGAPSSRLWKVLARDTEMLGLPGGCAEVPGEPARAMLVALHAAQHGRDGRKVLGDLKVALAKVPFGVWRRASVLSRELDALPALAAGLRLLPDGELIAADLGLPRSADTETVLLASARVPTAIGFARLAASSGLCPRAAFLVRKLFPTAAFLRHAYPVARRGRLGLGIAYVWRALWLLVHAPVGAIAWRRAARGPAGPS